MGHCCQNLEKCVSHSKCSDIFRKWTSVCINWNYAILLKLNHWQILMISSNYSKPSHIDSCATSLLKLSDIFLFLTHRASRVNLTFSQTHLSIIKSNLNNGNLVQKCQNHQNIGFWMNGDQWFPRVIPLGLYYNECCFMAIIGPITNR